jgi:hypothetical protein
MSENTTSLSLIKTGARSSRVVTPFVVLLKIIRDRKPWRL